MSTGDVFKDEQGNVTIFAPTATANGAANAPGIDIEAPTFITPPPPFVVHIHEGYPLLYQRVKEPS